MIIFSKKLVIFIFFFDVVLDYFLLLWYNIVNILEIGVVFDYGEEK